MQILIVYSINVSLVGTAFSQLVQFFQYFLDTVVDMNNAAKNWCSDTTQKNEVFHYKFLQQMWPNPQLPADLVTFTEKIFSEKLHFFSAARITSILKLNYKKIFYYFISLSAEIVKNCDWRLGKFVYR